MRKAFLSLSFLLGAVPLIAQLPLKPEHAGLLSRAFDENVQHDPLHCHVDPLTPFFDYAFRFEIGYIARCSLGQFEGNAEPVGAVLRIVPEGGKPIALGQHFTVPQVPAQLKDQINWQHLHSEIEFSGVFVAGEGEYEVNLALIDGRERVYRKSWRAKAFPHGNESKAGVAMEAGGVAPISLPLWKGPSPDGKGLRLTVLLDASPMNPYSRKLRAWDGAFLLGSVSSLLRHLPLASVRLVAFNLDQQTEVFRDDNFDSMALGKLGQALESLELGSISYGKLARENGWAELLTKVVRDSTASGTATDAVVFVGPSNRLTQRLEWPIVASPINGDLSFFYFEYYPRLGRDFPDVIEHVTNSLGGTTFRIHSPGELAQAIVRMQSELRIDPKQLANSRLQ